MRARLASLFAFATVTMLFGGCDSSSDDAPVDVVDPSDPTKHVTVTKSTVDLCNVMCDALIADYHVPETERAPCGYQCAEGFATTPDACFELVSCVHDTNICANGDVSASCRARAGACLSHWAIPNGLCLGCWKPSADIAGFRGFRTTDVTGTTTTVPVDLSSSTVTAQFPTPNGFVSFSGTGTADGHFTIPGVPACSTWVTLDTRFFWATTPTPDFTEDAIGRVGNVPTAHAGTQLVIDYTGLDPKAAGYLEVDVPNIASQGGALSVGGLDTPPSTATSGSLTLDWSGNALLTPADTIYVLQFTKAVASSTGLDYQRVASFAKVNGVAMTDGQPLHVAATFAPAAALASAKLDYRLEDFYAELPDAKTSTEPQDPGGEFSIYVDTAFPHGTGGTTMNLAYFQSFRPQPPPIDLGTIQYAVVEPGFDVFLDALLQVPHALEADGIPRSPQDYVVAHGLVAVMTSGPLKPTIGAIRDLRVNGTPIQPIVNGDPKQVMASGFGATPTVTWQPPDIGVASKYRAVFTSFEATPVTIRFDTTEPSLRIPPGALTVGRAYSLSVQANVTPDANGRDGVSVVNSGVIRP